MDLMFTLQRKKSVCFTIFKYQFQFPAVISGECMEDLSCCVFVFPPSFVLCLSKYLLMVGG